MRSECIKLVLNCVIHINLHTFVSCMCINICGGGGGGGVHVLREALVLEVELFLFCVSVAPIPTQTKPSKGIYSVYHITYVVHNRSTRNLSTEVRPDGEYTEGTYEEIATTSRSK